MMHFFYTNPLSNGYSPRNAKRRPLPQHHQLSAICLRHQIFQSKNDLSAALLGQNFTISRMLMLSWTSKETGNADVCNSIKINLFPT